LFRPSPPPNDSLSFPRDESSATLTPGTGTATHPHSGQLGVRVTPTARSGLTKKSLENVKAVVEAAGSTMAMC
jgi:hypothetical protein